MIDIHSHLIYDVDDGSKSLEDSINILSDLSNNGVTDIILTPHYIVETNYVSSKKDNIKKLKEIQTELKKQGISINTYLGNEIYIDKDILKYIQDNEMCSLNNKEYILVELPMNGIYSDYIEIFNNLINIGFKVVLAHPERYTTFQRDYSLIDEVYNSNVLFQCNVESILGGYGKEAKKTIKYILKNKMISFMGTDIHKRKNDYGIDKCILKFKKYLTDDEIEDIFIKNAKKIITKS